MQSHEPEIFGPNENIPCLTETQLADIHALLGDTYNIDREHKTDQDGWVHFFVDELPPNLFEQVRDEIQRLLGEDYAVMYGDKVDEETQEKMMIMSVSKQTL